MNAIKQAIQEYREYYRFYYSKCVMLPHADRQKYAECLARLKAAAFVEMEVQKFGFRDARGRL